MLYLLLIAMLGATATHATEALSPRANMRSDLHAALEVERLRIQPRTPEPDFERWSEKSGLLSDALAELARIRADVTIDELKPQIGVIARALGRWLYAIPRSEWLSEANADIRARVIPLLERAVRDTLAHSNQPPARRREVERQILSRLWWLDRCWSCIPYDTNPTRRFNVRQNPRLVREIVTSLNRRRKLTCRERLEYRP